eukprot:3583178-Pyramimonas_sp.AAC.1
MGFLWNSHRNPKRPTGFLQVSYRFPIGFLSDSLRPDRIPIGFPSDSRGPYRIPVGFLYDSYKVRTDPIRFP